MKTRNQSRIAVSLALLVGIWVILSPLWISVSGGALASVIIMGLVIVAASIARYFRKNVVPSLVMGLAAAWLLLSTIAYGIEAAAAWNQILSGIVLAVLAYWDWAEVTELQQGSGRHHTTAA